MKKKGWRNEPYRHSLSSRGIKSVDPSKKVVDIMDKTGLLDRMWLEIETNQEIRDLEAEARANRPAGTPRNTPLTQFLSPEKANRLEDLRRQKKVLKETEELAYQRAGREMRKEGLVMVPTEKGVVLGQLATVKKVYPPIPKEEAEKVTYIAEDIAMKEKYDLPEHLIQEHLLDLGRELGRAPTFAESYEHLDKVQRRLRQ